MSEKQKTDRTRNIPAGTVFSRWTVVADDGKGKYRKVSVACACGTIGLVLARHLKSGHSRGCRMCCVHGHATNYRQLCSDDAVRSRLLEAIRGAVKRCTKESDKDYHRYGGRGIRVHPDWLANRQFFFAYLLTLPGHEDPVLQIDRINNDGNYEPGNLRFATHSENVRNSRRHKPMPSKRS